MTLAISVPEHKSTPKSSTKDIKVLRGVSEGFCEEFHLIVSKVSKDINTGKKPKFIKVA